MRDNQPVIRPGTIILTLVLMGITALFAGCCAAYVYFVITAGTQVPHPPWLFLINIPVLLAATYSLRKARRVFDHPPFRRFLTLAIVFSLLFGSIQAIGWWQFFHVFSFRSSQVGSFLFILSALHLLHVFAGIPFLIRALLMTRNATVRAERSYAWWQGFLKGLTRYWRFLDILWILLVLILWLGYLLVRIK